MAKKSVKRHKSSVKKTVAPMTGSKKSADAASMRDRVSRLLASAQNTWSSLIKPRLLSAAQAAARWLQHDAWPRLREGSRYGWRWLTVTRKRWWGRWLANSARATESPAFFTIAALLVVGTLITVRYAPLMTSPADDQPQAGPALVADHSPAAIDGDRAPKPKTITKDPRQTAAIASNQTETGEPASSERAAQPIQRMSEAKEYKLKRGETLVNLLQRAKFKRSLAYSIANAMDPLTDMRRLRAGTVFYVASKVAKIDAAQNANTERTERYIWFRDRFDREVWATLTPRDGRKDAVSAETRAIPTLDLTSVGSGTIESSLYIDGKKAGLPDAVLDQVINLMAFSVDFQRDIRTGDTFEIFFERRYSPKYKDTEEGRLLYTNLILRGDQHEASYYVDSDGRGDYFDSKGASARRTLMKTPVDGARLTSRYGPRLHPVLGYHTKHKGIDFGAPRGTPIKAAGDGVIERANRYGAYGNYVRIRHGSGFKTAYAHLSRFARGIKKGRRVQQGDIIGYVGATGRVTGAHLHYEVLKNDVQINPSTLKSPRAKQLKGPALARFKSFHGQLMTTMLKTEASMAAGARLGAPKTASKSVAGEDAIAGVLSR